MWRAWVSGRERRLRHRSPVESEKYSAVSSRISGGGISCLGLRDQVLQRPLGELLSIGWPVSSDQATTRTSAPSSSRTIWSNFDATNSIDVVRDGDVSRARP